MSSETPYVSPLRNVPLHRMHLERIANNRYLTIDRWREEQDWLSFLSAFGSAYESLDAQFEGLAVTERSLFEGSS